MSTASHPLSLETMWEAFSGFVAEVGTLRSRVERLEGDLEKEKALGGRWFGGRRARKDRAPLPPLPPEGLDLTVCYYGRLRRRQICFAKDLLQALGCDTRRTALSFVGADILEVVLSREREAAFSATLIAHRHAKLLDFDPASPLRVTKRGLPTTARADLARAACIRRWRILQQHMVSDDFVDFFERKIRALEAAPTASLQPSTSGISIQRSSSLAGPAPTLSPTAPLPPSTLPSSSLVGPAPTLPPTAPHTSLSPTAAPFAPSASEPVTSAAASTSPSVSLPVSVTVPVSTGPAIELPRAPAPAPELDEHGLPPFVPLQPLLDRNIRYCSALGCMKNEPDLERDGLKLLRCGRCAAVGKARFYCSKECQRNDWRTVHKFQCAANG